MATVGQVLYLSEPNLDNRGTACPDMSKAYLLEDFNSEQVENWD